MTTFAKNEILGLIALVEKNRDSARLQKISNISYLDSINLKVKLSEMIEDLEEQEWLKNERRLYYISFDYDTQEMVIIDNQNDVEYKIPSHLVDEGKIAQYYIVDAENEADELEDYMIPEAKSSYDKELMREDLQTLRNCQDEFAFGYYGTNGFVTKESNIEEFNKICLELIESYKQIKMSMCL